MKFIFNKAAECKRATLLKTNSFTDNFEGSYSKFSVVIFFKSLGKVFSSNNFLPKKLKNSNPLIYDLPIKSVSVNFSVVVFSVCSCSCNL